MKVEKKIVKRYNSTRKVFRRNLLCYAPFVNMYFNIHGDAAPCWLGFINPDSYPAKSIRDIWFGSRFGTFRSNIKKCYLAETCGVCLTNLKNGNYISVLSKAYDLIGNPKKYPLMMELELDNTCNLECIMCNGFLSSSIRRIREQKEALQIPYDETFVEQLNEFIPHLKELRLNGGEPFLSKICMKIIENVLKINPGLKIVMATNGTVWNDNIEKLLRRGNFHINISIDSLVKETYEKIRVNGNFDNVMNNLNHFLAYCRRKGTTLCILVNPMRQNWREMPDFVRFCNAHNIPLWFNTIQYPRDCSLWALPSEELQNIFDLLSKEEFDKSNFTSESVHNYRSYLNLVQVQIFQWLQDSLKAHSEDIEDDTAKEKSFENKLRAYIDSLSLSEEVRNMNFSVVMQKLNIIFLRIEKSELNKEEISKLILETPVEIVYNELLTRDDDDLFQLIQTYVK